MPLGALDILVAQLLGDVLRSKALDALVLVDDGRHATRDYLLALDFARLLAALAAVLAAVRPVRGHPLRWTGLLATGLRTRGLEHRVAQLLVGFLVRTTFHAAHPPGLVTYVHDFRKFSITKDFYIESVSGLFLHFFLQVTIVYKYILKAKNQIHIRH